MDVSLTNCFLKIRLAFKFQATKRVKVKSLTSQLLKTFIPAAKRMTSNDINIMEVPSHEVKPVYLWGLYGKQDSVNCTIHDNLTFSKISEIRLLSYHVDQFRLLLTNVCR